MVIPFIQDILYILLLLATGALVLFNVVYVKEIARIERVLAISLNQELRWLCKNVVSVSTIILAVIAFLTLVHFLT